MDLLTLDRFVSEVNPNLICPICMNVLNDPVQDENEHTFCRFCIYRWLEQQITCPIDRTYINRYKLKPASRLLKNLLSDLEITCEYREQGCTRVMKLDQLPSHVNECQFQPDKIIECPNGCELVLERNELPTHNCIRELKTENKELQKSIMELNERFKKLEEELKIFSINSQQSVSTTATATAVAAISISYNSLAKIFLILFFILLFKYTFSLELLATVFILCLLIIFAKIFLIYHQSQQKIVKND